MPTPPPKLPGNIYGGIPDQGPGGFEGQLLAFAEDLREEGMALGTSELLDAFAALEHVPWTEQADFKEALAATLAKSPEDRRVFELVFERFFFRAVEAEASRRGVSEGKADLGELQVDLDTLRQQIAAALRDGSDAALRDLARHYRLENMRIADFLEPPERALGFQAIDGGLHRGIGGTLLGREGLLHFANRQGSAGPQRLHDLEFELAELGK